MSFSGARCGQEIGEETVPVAGTRDMAMRTSREDFRCPCFLVPNVAPLSHI